MNSATLSMIRRLARSGDTERAWELFAEAGFEDETAQADTLSLKGRLIKDRALKASAIERSPLLQAARHAYLRAATCAPATYPLINAATIALLDGDRAQAAELAQRVLAMLDSGSHEAETSYWLNATRAEACLLLGRGDDAKAALAEAVRQAPRAWEDHASTLRHFRLILETLDQSADWLDAHRPPASLHFSGIIQVAPDQPGSAERIAGAVDAIGPGFAFGALAAGADIMAAEILLERNVELHIMLPSTIEAFRRESVSHFGAEWEGRFDAVLAAAHAVDAIDTLDLVSQAGIFVSDEMAMGMTIRQAQMLESNAAALRIGEGARAQGSLLDAAWDQRGLPIRRVALDRDGQATALPLPSFAREAVVALSARHDPGRLAEAGGQVDSLGGFAIARFGDPVAAAPPALAQGRDGVVSIGIAYGAYDPDHGDAELRETATRIAGAGHPHRVPVSRAAALALTRETPELRCENFGHIASAHGDIALSMLSAG